MAAVVFVLRLGALALWVASTLEDDRNAAEARFEERARSAAAFTHAALDRYAMSRGAQAAELLSGRRIEPSDLREFMATTVAGVPSPGVAVFTADGKPLAARPTTLLRRRGLGSRPEVRLARRGDHATGSNLRIQGTDVVGVAAPFDTPHGARVVVDYGRIELIDGFLDSYLLAAPAATLARAYVVDRGGRTVAATRFGGLGKPLADRHLAAALRRGGSGTYEDGGTRHYVAAPIRHSTWRLVMTIPEEGLAPTNSGLVWFLYAAFAVAMAAALALVIGLLERRRHLAVEAERRRAEAELEVARGQDPLTGLPNRQHFRARVGQALGELRPEDEGVTVLCMDISRFKHVNDSLGHEAGDEVLRELGRRLRDHLDERDTVARLGGDQFAIASAAGGSGHAVRLAAVVEHVTSQPFAVSGRELFITVIAGVAVATEPAPADAVIHNAEAALHYATEAGSRFQLFDPATHRRLVERIETERDLRLAVERGELRVLFQPIVALETARVTELEALVRWQHPKRGMLAPADFVEVAEESGLIVPIGEWVLSEAGRHLAEWRAESESPICVSVNASVHQLEDAGFVRHVDRTLEQNGLDPNALCIEVTETTVMRESELAHDSLRRLKKMGVRIALDDFGTGHSALAQLVSMAPIDTLKIDRSFVAQLDDTRHAAVVEAVLGLADALALRAIAEGVETREQVAALQRLGCRVAQGFFFSRPIPPQAVASVLRGWIHDPAVWNEAGSG